MTATSSSLFSSLRAQVGAEIRMRLRSVATPIALAALCAATFFWIPDPTSHAASLTWEIDGRIQAPVYSMAYVGLSVAILSCILLPLGGFYLVAGSVQRDRERGVGAILAATPLSKSAYLGGKFAANVAYLLVLDLLALLTGLVAFVRYGTGSFTLLAFAGPYLVMTLPVVVVVASMAVFFDVTPGLRGRGGLVIWFFFFLFVMLKLAFTLAGAEDDPSTAKTLSRPIFDPAGVATAQWLVRDTIPKEATSVAAGHASYAQRTIQHVPWKGIRVTPALIGIRLANMLFAAIPLGLAVLIFDRFDPARGRKRARRASVFERVSRRFRRGEPEIDEAGAIMRRAAPLTAVSPRPSAAGAILAEARLIWEGASWIKWPLALSTILAGVLPGNLAQGIFLLLLVPVISEVAAREDLAGTRALVFSQPGVPRSPVLWKTAALGLFVLMIGAPMAVRDAFASPARGLACVAGLAAIALAASGLGALSSGGKLFTGLYVVVWYMGMSGAPFADFTASLGDKPEPVWGAVYLGIAAALVLGALGREKLREA